MLRELVGHMRQNVVAYIALFVALGGTGAYAANEWTGANIVDESLTGAAMSRDGPEAGRGVRTPRRRLLVRQKDFGDRGQVLEVAGLSE